MHTIGCGSYLQRPPIEAAKFNVGILSSLISAIPINETLKVKGDDG